MSRKIWGHKTSYGLQMTISTLKGPARISYEMLHKSKINTIERGNQKYTTENQDIVYKTLNKKE